MPPPTNPPLLAGEFLPETDEDRARIKARAQLTRKNRLDAGVYGQETPPQGLQYRTDAIGWSDFANQYDYDNQEEDRQDILEKHFSNYNIQAMENAGMTNARDSRRQFKDTFLPDWKLGKAASEHITFEDSGPDQDNIITAFGKQVGSGFLTSYTDSVSGVASIAQLADESGFSEGVEGFGNDASAAIRESFATNNPGIAADLGSGLGQILGLILGGGALKTGIKAGEKAIGKKALGKATDAARTTGLETSGKAIQKIASAKDIADSGTKVSGALAGFGIVGAGSGITMKQFMDEYRESELGGEPITQELLAKLSTASIILGGLDAVVPGRFVNKKYAKAIMDKLNLNPDPGLLRRVATTGGAEGMTELLQSIGFNKVLQETLIDEDRELLDGALREGGIGATLGAFLELALGRKTGPRRKKKVTDPEFVPDPDAVDQEIIDQDFNNQVANEQFDETQKGFLTLPNGGKVKDPKGKDLDEVTTEIASSITALKKNVTDGINVGPSEYIIQKLQEAQAFLSKTLPNSTAQARARTTVKAIYGRILAKRIADKAGQTGRADGRSKQQRKADNKGLTKQQITDRAKAELDEFNAQQSAAQTVPVQGAFDNFDNELPQGNVAPTGDASPLDLEAVTPAIRTTIAFAARNAPETLQIVNANKLLNGDTSQMSAGERANAEAFIQAVENQPAPAAAAPTAAATPNLEELGARQDVLQSEFNNKRDVYARRDRTQSPDREGQAVQAALNELNLVKEEISVIRADGLQEVPDAAELVVGDIIFHGIHDQTIVRIEGEPRDPFITLESDSGEKLTLRQSDIRESIYRTPAQQPAPPPENIVPPINTGVPPPHIQPRTPEEALAAQTRAAERGAIDAQLNAPEGVTDADIDTQAQRDAELDVINQAAADAALAEYNAATTEQPAPTQPTQEQTITVETPLEIDVVIDEEGRSVAQPDKPAYVETPVFVKTETEPTPVVVTDTSAEDIVGLADEAKKGDVVAEAAVVLNAAQGDLDALPPEMQQPAVEKISKVQRDAILKDIEDTIGEVEAEVSTPQDAQAALDAFNARGLKKKPQPKTPAEAVEVIKETKAKKTTKKKAPAKKAAKVSDPNKGLMRVLVNKLGRMQNVEIDQLLGVINTMVGKPPTEYSDIQNIISNQAGVIVGEVYTGNNAVAPEAAVGKIKEAIETVQKSQLKASRKRKTIIKKEENLKASPSAAVEIVPEVQKKVTPKVDQRHGVVDNEGVNLRILKYEQLAPVNISDLDANQFLALMSKDIGGVRQTPDIMLAKSGITQMIDGAPLDEVISEIGRFSDEQAQVVTERFLRNIEAGIPFSLAAKTDNERIGVKNILTPPKGEPLPLLTENTLADMEQWLEAHPNDPLAPQVDQVLTIYKCPT